MSKITPACAGKSGCGRRWFALSPDHPRMRGEEFTTRTGSSAGMGSPPHARGRGEHQHRGRHLAGITPACAGKRRPDTSGSGWAWDHPRMRGEEHMVPKRSTPAMGSPPRVRGRGSRKPQRPVRNGITPARAGKSGAVWTAAHKSGDHPRACGEEPVSMQTKITLAGSPPRVRGRGMTQKELAEKAGITPARAGKRQS